ncbi:MAG: conjugal transfer protein TraF [Spirochaetales bacterium]|nr:conjugal transfer protein TraF [Spirochaetales bacterium]
MKQLLIVLTILICLTGFAFGQETILTAPFVPQSPEVMGQGGSFTAIAAGYNSLFTNPAGFGSEKGSLTIVSANPWVYVRPDQVIDFVAGLEGSENPEMALLPLINDQVTAGGFGIGFSTGLGWTGKGLGLGVVGMVDSHIVGDTLLGASGHATATVGLIGGLAIPFNIFGMKLTVGGDVRPMYRAYIPMDNTVVIGLLRSLSEEGSDPLTYLMTQSAYAGVGLGIDLGAMLDIGPFTVGLSMRDLFGTRFNFGQSTLEDIVASLETEGALPEGTDVQDTYMIPMEINVGAAWHPDLGGFSFILDPKVHVDLKDPIGIIRDKRSPWTLLHIGAEAKMFRFISLRGGFNQGYITGGVGMKLLFLDINASFFTLERGMYIGDKPNSGVTLEAALRF